MKKLNISLLKYIIKTDFFILENKKLLQTKFFNLMSTKNFNVLDIIELNSSIKQQIRLLQFAKKKTFKSKGQIFFSRRSAQSAKF